MKKILSIKGLIIQRLIYSVVYLCSSFLLWYKIYKNMGLSGWSLSDGLLLFGIIVFLQLTLVMGVESGYKDVDPMNFLFYRYYRGVELLQVGLLVFDYVIINDGIFNPTKYMICVLAHMVVFGIVICIHIKIITSYKELEYAYIEKKIGEFVADKNPIDLKNLYVFFGYLVCICLVGGYCLENIFYLSMFIVGNTIIMYKLFVDLYSKLNKNKTLWIAIVISNIGILIVYYFNLNRNLFWLFKGRNADEMAMIIIIFYFVIYKDMIPVFLKNQRLNYMWCK